VCFSGTRVGREILRCFCCNAFRNGQMQHSTHGSVLRAAVCFSVQVGFVFFLSIFWGFFPLFAAIFTFPQVCKTQDTNKLVIVSMQGPWDP
jgi:hypothetical protein